MVLAAKDDAKKRGVAIGHGPSGATWGQTEELLATVADRLAVLIEIQKAKPKQPTLYPRPVTAFERAEFRRRQKAHEALTAQVIAR